MNTMKKAFAAALALCLLLAAVPACAEWAAVETGAPAVDFSLEDQYGRTWSLQDMRGKVVFLNIWATWCPPCVAEMPDIEALYQENGQNTGDILILGVSSPLLEDEGTDVAAHLKENGLTYPVLTDTEWDLVMPYLTACGNAIPVTAVIDGEGVVRDIHLGMMSKAEMVEALKTAGASPAE